MSKQVKRDGMKEESGGEAACATSALLIQPIGGNDLDGFVVLPPPVVVVLCCEEEASG